MAKTADFQPISHILAMTEHRHIVTMEN